MLPTLGGVSSWAALVTLACVVAGGAFVVTGEAIEGRARRAGVAAAVLAAGLLGARSFQLALDGDAPWSLAGVLAPRGGFTWYGGLAGGALAAVVLARAAHVSAARLCDDLAAPAALGLAIGRLGCLAAGCCWGKPTRFPIALVFHDFRAPVRPIGVPLHAVQLYESAGALALAAGLWWWRRRRRFDGEIVVALLACYGALRFGLELLRPGPRGHPPLGLTSWSQLAAGATALGAFPAWWLGRRARPSTARPRAHAAE